MASTYLTRTNGSTSSTLTKGTFSAWVKRSNPSTEQTLFTGNNSANTYRDFVRFEANSQLRVREAQGSFNLETSAVYRDVNGWYHIVAEIDTTLATSTDRVKVYVNGERVTSFSSTTYPSQNHTLTGWSNNTLQTVGRDGKDNNTPFDGSMAHVHWIDGTAYDASAFGETDTATGIWKPKTAPVVTYGTNGFFLKFENSASFGTDSSPNGNNFTVNGTITQTIDTPSNVFATFNPLVYNPAQADYNPLFSNGNTTTASNTSVNAFSNARATLAMLSGKYYAEFKITSSDANMDIGLIKYTSGVRSANNWGLYYQNDGAVALKADGSININNVTSGTSFSGYASGDILQLAFDRTSEKIWLGKNGIWFNSGDPSNGTNELLDLSSTIGNDEFWTFAVGFYHNVSEVWNANFGNGVFGSTPLTGTTYSDTAGLGIFKYEVPAGYYALCTKNINTQEYN
jgi:hypothetical protein